MSDYIFENGQWVPCANLIELEQGEGWEDAAERVGIQDLPSHRIGLEDGFRVEVHALRYGRVFEPDERVTHVIIITTLDGLYSFYCPGFLAMIDKLRDFAIISCAEHFSNELRYAVQRVEAREAT